MSRRCVVAVISGSKEVPFACQGEALWSSYKSATFTCMGCAWQEIDTLCEEWQPEPLHKPLPNSQALPEPPVISRCCCIQNTPFVTSRCVRNMCRPEMS